MFKVVAHRDADGIASAALFQKAISQDIEVSFPTEFGSFHDEEIMLDMRPISPDFEGKVYDHHPNHPEKRKYKLEYRDVPTARIIWDTFREDFKPERDGFLLVVGCVGDVQPYHVVPEVWRANKGLLLNRHYISPKKTSSWSLPIYKLLSSSVNAMSRIGKPEEAYETVLNCRDAFELLEHPKCKSAKYKVSQERTRVFKKMAPFEINTGILFAKFESAYRLAGMLAAMLNEATKLTTVVANVDRGKAAIRGPLTYTILEECKNRGLEGGGHPAAGGVSFDNIETLEVSLRNVF